MKIYLVGGAVRDQLLGHPVKEKDWVVVGGTPNEMLQKNFKQVGKDFPVFLHPETKEEYALARIERKVGRGYTGFTFDASSKVTLEEDLKRRDLTINAIALDTDSNQLIDPYHGQSDLNNKILRHVSEAFIEDPVRVLRVARFAARFSDFKVAPETVALMNKMVENGEVDALVAERVWKEFEKALSEKHPEKFFEVLQNCGARKILFPEQISVDALIRAAKVSSDTRIRFSVLMHAIPEAEIKVFSDRFRLPSDYRELAFLVSKYFTTYQKAASSTPEQVLDLLQAMDAFRREERFKHFLLAAEIASEENKSSEFLLKCFQAALAIDLKTILAEKLMGKEIEKRIRAARLHQIEKVFG